MIANATYDGPFICTDYADPRITRLGKFLRKNKLDEDVKHLKNQKKNLIKLCKEITDKKTERFYEVYNEINNNFEKIYSQLSEGGEGELILEDPDNILDTPRSEPW